MASPCSCLLAVLVERTPSRFPIEWVDPADARLDWIRDPAFPDPIPMLSGSLLPILDEAVEAAAKEYSVPVRYRTARVNTYIYRAEIPVAGDGRILLGLDASGAQRLRAARPRTPDTEGPAVDGDLETVPAAILRERLEAAVAELRIRATSHAVAALPALFAAEATRGAPGEPARCLDLLRDDLGHSLAAGGATARLEAIAAELGHRCAGAGVLDRPDDVVHLTLEELRSLPQGGDKRPVVAARRAELEFFGGVEPPPSLA
jgi:hypothetical protein